MPYTSHPNYDIAVLNSKLLIVIATLEEAQK